MLGSPILYLKAMRILMFQLSGFYCRGTVFGVLITRILLFRVLYLCAHVCECQAVKTPALSCGSNDMCHNIGALNN